MDFCDRSKIQVDLTRAYKKVRLVANVEADTEGTGSPESLEKFLPLRMLPAQKPCIDLCKTSKAVAAKTSAEKRHSSPPGASGDSS